MSLTEIETNGWTAVPTYTVQDITFPFEDKLISDVQAFVKARFSIETYNHSMRVFYWEALSPSTWALTYFLHDIGTAEAYLTSTRMSLDIYGGIKAMEVLKGLGGSIDQAEAIAKAIIRHQDIDVDSTIAFLGQLIQLATLYDNVGVYKSIKDFPNWIDDTTRGNINTAFPRHGWYSLFACTVRKEVGNKPWCHSTHIPQFDEKIEANSLMKSYD
ncbi:cyanamide hydratase [Fusarium graminearum]|nr:cyanamide hydratase [Fusarium graminearum]